LTAVLDGGATTATPDVEQSDEAHAVNAPNALNLALAAILAGAKEHSRKPHAKRLRRCWPKLL
jgi:hypothetical protein